MKPSTPESTERPLAVIIGDNPDIANKAEAKLLQQGYNVGKVSVAEAQAVSALNADLIILHFTHPQTEQTDFTRFLIDLESGNRCPLIGIYDKSLDANGESQDAKMMADFLRTRDGSESMRSTNVFNIEEFMMLEFDKNSSGLVSVLSGQPLPIVESSPGRGGLPPTTPLLQKDIKAGGGRSAT